MGDDVAKAEGQVDAVATGVMASAAQAKSEAVQSVTEMVANAQVQVAQKEAQVQNALGRARAAEAALEAKVTMHPVVAVLVAALCGVPFGVVVSWLPPLSTISKAVLGVGH